MLDIIYHPCPLTNRHHGHRVVGGADYPRQEHAPYTKHRPDAMKEPHSSHFLPSSRVYFSASTRLSVHHYLRDLHLACCTVPLALNSGR